MGIFNYDLAKANKEYQAKQSKLRFDFIKKLSSYTKATKSQIEDCEASIKEIAKVKDTAQKDLIRANDLLLKVTNGD